MAKSSNEKNRGGRPKLANPRRFPIGFRVTQEERERIRKLALAHGLTPGEYARIRALSGQLPRPPVPPINVSGWRKLARTTKNLNQLMRAIHQGKVPSTAAIERVLQDVIEEVKRFRLALLGAESGDGDDSKDQ